MWFFDDLARQASESLAQADGQLRDEQAVRGIDALDEVGLHPVLAGGFVATGLGVWREWPYPGKVKKRPGGAERVRCDLVLTPDAHARLVDPVAELKEIDRAAGTLFEPIATQVVPAGPVVEAEDALWLEIKVVAQHSFVDGVPGPNRTYSSELVAGPAGDVVKLASDGAIGTRVVGVVLFAESEEAIDHDFNMAVHRLLDRDLPIGSPAISIARIEDRVGNAAVGVMLIPVRV